MHVALLGGTVLPLIAVYLYMLKRVSGGLMTVPELKLPKLITRVAAVAPLLKTLAELDEPGLGAAPCHNNDSSSAVADASAGTGYHGVGRGVLAALRAGSRTANVAGNDVVPIDHDFV